MKRIVNTFSIKCDCRLLDLTRPARDLMDAIMDKVRIKVTITNNPSSISMIIKDNIMSQEIMLARGIMTTRNVIPQNKIPKMPIIRRILSMRILSIEPTPQAHTVEHLCSVLWIDENYDPSQLSQNNWSVHYLNQSKTNEKEACGRAGLKYCQRFKGQAT